MFSHAIYVWSNSLLPNFNNNIVKSLEKQTIDFAHLSNIVALKGGEIKKEQFLSADMADIFSNIYLAYSIYWEYENNKTSKLLTEYCIKRLINENKKIINKIVDNYSIISKIPIWHLKTKVKNDSYKEKEIIIKEIIKNKKIINKIKTNIFIENNILEKLENLNSLDKQSKAYSELYNDVIQVGEYTIEK